MRSAKITCWRLRSRAAEQGAHDAPTALRELRRFQAGIGPIDRSVQDRHADLRIAFGLGPERCQAGDRGIRPREPQNARGCPSLRRCAIESPKMTRSKKPVSPGSRAKPARASRAKRVRRKPLDPIAVTTNLNCRTELVRTADTSASSSTLGPASFPMHAKSNESRSASGHVPRANAGATLTATRALAPTACALHLIGVATAV